MLVAFTCSVSLAGVACGESDDGAAPAPEPTAAPRTPLPAPDVTLSAEDKELWAPLPPDRSAIPVLLYHGIGPESDFSNAADASYGVDTEDFAKQMTMIAHAGYETIDLQTFIDFVQREAGRSSAAAAAAHVRRRARGLVDGRRRDPARARLQRRHVRRRRPRRRRRSGVPDVAGAPDRAGQRPLAAAAPLRRGPSADPVRAGRRRLRAVLRVHGAGRGLRRLARAGAVGHRMGPADARRARPRRTSRSRSRPRTATTARTARNDPRIPDDLLGWLTERYDAVFTQDVNARARPGSGQPLGRIQVTRAHTGGELHEMLLSGEQ